MNPSEAKNSSSFGQVVSVLTFSYDGPSSNPDEA